MPQVRSYNTYKLLLQTLQGILFTLTENRCVQPKARNRQSASGFLLHRCHIWRAEHYRLEMEENRVGDMSNVDHAFIISKKIGLVTIKLANHEYYFYWRTKGNFKFLKIDSHVQFICTLLDLTKYILPNIFHDIIIKKFREMYEHESHMSKIVKFNIPYILFTWHQKAKNWCFYVLYQKAKNWCFHVLFAI